MTATAAGDYFLHVSAPAGSTLFSHRLFIRSQGSGFALGLASNSGTGAATTYGAAELAFGQNYRAVVSWTFIDGAANDAFNIYVDPSDPVQANNTPYLAGYTWSGSPEPTEVAAVNLRQGGAASGAVLTVDNLTVATDFASAIAPVPEPATVLGLAAAALGAARFRRRAA